MLRSSFSFTLFQVVCPVKVWTLVSCAWYNKHQQEKEIRQFREKARQHKQLTTVIMNCLISSCQKVISDRTNLVGGWVGARFWGSTEQGRSPDCLCDTGRIAQHSLTPQYHKGCPLSPGSTAHYTPGIYNTGPRDCQMFYLVVTLSWLSF